MVHDEQSCTRPPKKKKSVKRKLHKTKRAVEQVEVILINHS